MSKTVAKPEVLWTPLTGNTMVFVLADRGVAKQVHLAGSLRRWLDSRHDCDVVVVLHDDDPEKGTGREQLECGLNDLGLDEVRVTEKRFRAVVPGLGPIDGVIAQESQLGAALLYYTGPKEFNVRMRALAKRTGEGNRFTLKLNEYGLWIYDSYRREDIECMAGRTEDEVFKALGMAPVPPALRGKERGR